MHGLWRRIVKCFGRPHTVPHMTAQEEQAQSDQIAERVARETKMLDAIRENLYVARQHLNMADRRTEGIQQHRQGL